MIAAGVLSPADRAFDTSEWCAFCGCASARVKWVFVKRSERTGERLSLYLCAHDSALAENRLRNTTILSILHPVSLV